MDWQPIETAPKDGSYVLLGNEFGAWVGHYKRVAPSGFIFDDPWHTMMLNHRHIKGAKHYTPSHWMRLPEKPTK